MAAPLNVNPEVVVQRLGNQIGGLAAELAMRDTQLEAAQTALAERDARIAELEQEVVELKGEDAEAPQPADA